MHDLSRIAHMEPSPIRRIYEKAITMDDIIFFSIGEPDFKTPDAVISAPTDVLITAVSRSIVSQSDAPAVPAITTRPVMITAAPIALTAFMFRPP